MTLYELVDVFRRQAHALEFGAESRMLSGAHATIAIAKAKAYRDAAEQLLAALSTPAPRPETERFVCLTCGHEHFFEADEGGFDSAETIPWGACKTCACKTPNYNPRFGAAPRPETHSCEWKDAIIDACVVDWIFTAEHETNPRKAVNDLLCWQQRIALDPAVSEDAAKLHARIAELEAGAAPRRADAPPPLLELVEEFNGWWHLNREGSVNAAYARIDKFTKDARRALEELDTESGARGSRDGWQPIETAPKDGREILCTWVYRLSNGRTYWPNVMHVLSWFPDWHGEGQGAWVLDGDFAAHFTPDGIHETPPTAFGEPTHWMALPAAPGSETP